MRVAAVQMQSTPDVAANRAAADRLVREAVARDGAQLVVLPEKWPCLGAVDDLRAAAEPLDGPTVAWAGALAAELGIDLVAGSFSELGAERLRNTSVHAGPDGEVAAVYRKVHMFDAEVDGVRYHESAAEAPGEELVTTSLADGTCAGMAVCYDLRFPELFRGLALRGARVLVLPSAFTQTTTRAHWEVLLRARAIEEGCFVVAANQAGEHMPGLVCGGRSMVVDPWGDVLGRLPEAGEGVLTRTIDLERVDEVRARIPSLANRRPAAYA